MLKHAKVEQLCPVNGQRTWPHYVTYLFQSDESYSNAGQSISQKFPGGSLKYHLLNNELTYYSIKLWIIKILR